MQPSHEKACFFSFREHAFPQALFISSKQFLQPRLLSILVSFLEPIWAPLANFFDSNFRDSKNTNCLSRGIPQAEGIWDTSRVRGELGSIWKASGAGASGRPLGSIWGASWEASGKHLGSLWEASGRSSGRPGRPQEAQRRLGGKSCQNHCVFQQISSRPPILSRRNESDPHQVL